MAELFHQAYAKMSPGTMEWLEKQGYSRDKMMSKLPKSPTCVEGRYLREVEWLKANHDDRNIWLMSMVFGFCANQPGYVLDLINNYEQKFGRDGNLDAVQKLAVSVLKELGV